MWQLWQEAVVLAQLVVDSTEGLYEDYVSLYMGTAWCAAQVVQAAAAAVWGCATSSRTRRLLTEIGAVEALLTMLQMTLVMDTASGPGDAAPPPGQEAAPQSADRDRLQVEKCRAVLSCAVLSWSLLCCAALGWAGLGCLWTHCATLHVCLEDAVQQSSRIRGPLAASLFLCTCCMLLAHSAKSRILLLCSNSWLGFPFSAVDVIVATLHCMHLLFLCVTCLLHDC